MSYTRTIGDWERLWQALPDLAFEDARPFLTRLTSHPAFIMGQILPLLAHVTPAPEPYIAASYGAREASTCLQIFVWPAGATTAIHDHTSWGAYHCVFGSLLEERYARLDDGTQPNTAHLRKLWRRVWRQTDGASTVRPYAGGIHRIANLGARPAVSVHLYGPRMGLFDGRDYDPARDFVCDRLELDDVALLDSRGFTGVAANVL
jgi:predicted metal-dependent enzyme (double-stranded beta helix superfamily)